MNVLTTVQQKPGKLGVGARETLQNLGLLSMSAPNVAKPGIQKDECTGWIAKSGAFSGLVHRKLHNLTLEILQTLCSQEWGHMKHSKTWDT